MWAAVIPGREAWGACELRLKPSRRMSVNFKDEPRYKLTTANPKARIFPFADLSRTIFSDNVCVCLHIACSEVGKSYLSKTTRIKQGVRVQNI